MAQDAAQHYRLHHRCHGQGQHQRSGGGSGLEIVLARLVGELQLLHCQHQRHGQQALQDDGPDRYPQVADAGHVDQCRFCNHGGGGYHFGRQQEGERPGTRHEFAALAEQAHQRLARDTQRQRDPGLRGNDPEPHLAHLPGNGGVVLLLQPGGDHRAKHRLEAGLELLRQAGDLLRHVIDAHRAGPGEQAEDEHV